MAPSLLASNQIAGEGSKKCVLFSLCANEPQVAVGRAHCAVPGCSALCRGQGTGWREAPRDGLVHPTSSSALVLLRCSPYLVVFNLALHTQCLSAARRIQSSPWGLMYKAWPVFIWFPELSSLLPSVAAQRHFCQAMLDSPQNPSTFRKGLGSLSSQFPYPFALCSGIWFDWL